jgi:predicted metal-dependent phosphoesterase TrpH
MPARQPFTALCQTLARPTTVGRADLHVHTTASDGEYTPAQVVDLARRSGLVAVAITDHDTVAGVAPARSAADGSRVEIISGVEITAEYLSKEIHLLGLFIRPEDGPLCAALGRLREHRQGRYWEMVARLKRCGVALDDAVLQRQAATGTLGRRHLASLLVKQRQAGSVREAFVRYLGDHARAAVPKLRLAAAEAIALVRGAGGVAAWAHPPYDGWRDRLRGLAALGLGAVEVDFPGHRPSLGRAMCALAAELGLAITGGSDCHGPGHYRRAIGSFGANADELGCLRRRAASGG